MARPLRIIHPSGWYHVTARGNERRDIYRDDRDRAHFCGLLGQMTERFGVRLHAYVLMSNHYHLLLQLARPNLSAAVQWLNVSYSVWFNRRHRRAGHLLQGRFKSILVEPNGWGLQLSAYIHLNPVRVARLKLGKAERQRAAVGGAAAPPADLVRERLARLRAYAWSSYRAYVGLAKAPVWLCRDEVLARGGSPSDERARNYRQYVEKQVREGLGSTPWEELTDQVILGGAAFLQEIRAHLRGSKEAQTPRPWMREPVPLEKIIQTVEAVRGEKWADFRDRHGDRGRDLVLYLARRAGTMTLAQLAEAVGLKQDAAVSVAVNRYARELPGNKPERARAAAAAELLNLRM